MLDTAEAQTKATETFLLKNADAEDVAKQLKDLSDTGSSNSSLRLLCGRKVRSSRDLLPPPRKWERRRG